MEEKELKVISIDKLKEYARGEIVELPGFFGDEPFVVRLKRPSMMNMARSGKIPNELLVEANNLFSGGVGKVATENKLEPGMLNDLYLILDVICEECFVEPTFKQIKEAGVELTDEQYIAVFSYTQNGVKALKSFR